MPGGGLDTGLERSLARWREVCDLNLHVGIPAAVRTAVLVAGGAESPRRVTRSPTTTTRRSNHEVEPAVPRRAGPLCPSFFGCLSWSHRRTHGDAGDFLRHAVARANAGARRRGPSAPPRPHAEPVELGAGAKM